MSEPLRDRLLGAALAALFLIFASLVYWFRPKDLPQWLQVAQIIAVSAGILGGAWALHRFAHERRVRKADVLFRLYEDFQDQLETLSKIEDDREYGDLYAPLLEQALAVPAGAGWSKELKPLDRVFRHFLLVYNLYQNRQLDRETVRVTYRYYALMLMRDQRQLMRLYVHRYFPTLAEFFENTEVFPQHEHLFPLRVVPSVKVKKLVDKLRRHQLDPKRVLADFKDLDGKLTTGV